MRNRRFRRRCRTLNRRFSKTSRMLKTSSSFVLGSSKSSTYPRGYASGFDSPAALLDGRFEHPTGSVRRDEVLGVRAILKRRPSRLTPYALRLLGEFLHEVAELWKDELFHRQTYGVFGAGS